MQRCVVRVSKNYLNCVCGMQKIVLFSRLTTAVGRIDRHETAFMLHQLVQLIQSWKNQHRRYILCMVIVDNFPKRASDWPLNFFVINSSAAEQTPNSLVHQYNIEPQGKM